MPFTLSKKQYVDISGGSEGNKLYCVMCAPVMTDAEAPNGARAYVITRNHTYMLTCIFSGPSFKGYRQTQDSICILSCMNTFPVSGVGKHILYMGAKHCRPLVVHRLSA